ncbi:MAG TPA: carboxypeptidase regulatory-like domain-containing protein [Acidobacteriaceae bacterium]|nr:carboxypeptidase regulatory-like domain-containing protein [Acidobacteriaceae bacterium]
MPLQNVFTKPAAGRRLIGAAAAALMFLIALFVPMRATAQIDTGTVVGTVTDSTGAAVPQAVVTVRNEATGLVLTQKSTARGSYNFTALKVGTYTISAKAQGFDKAEQMHVDVTIQSRLEINLTLKPGEISATVEVNAAEAQLQTQEASVGQVVSEDQINNLPLNGRNFTLLAQLAPGTTTTYFDSGHGEVQSGSFTANGIVTTFNDYLLDGITNNNMTADFGNGNSFTLLPPPDALQEFKVETGNYSAEYGRSGGAVINAVTKSGQNTFFGDVWEYNRNAWFDAEDYFLKKGGLRRPKYNRNLFGGTIGGPIVIPHLVDGRDRFFFFGDYSGSRIVQGQAYTSSVPTALEHNSHFTDFTDLYSSTGTQTDVLGRVFRNGQIFDPATTRYLAAGATDPVTGLTTTKAGYVRDPFTSNGTAPGLGTCTTCVNVIPASRLSPVSVGLASLFPLPNTNGTNFSNNYVSAPVLRSTGDTFDTRFDQNISSQDQLFERVSYGNIPRSIPAPCSTLADCGTSATVGTESDAIFGAAVGETHIFSPRLVNEFRIGYNRIHMNRVQPYGDQGGLNQHYGVPGIPDAAPNGGLTQIKISGLSELGEHNNIPLNEIGAETQYNENVSFDRGKHSMRFGADYERMKNAINSAQFPHGYFSFTGSYVNNPNGSTFNLGIAQFAIEPAASSVAGVCPANLEQSGGSVTSGCGHYDYVGGSNQIQGSPLSQQDYRRPYFGTYFTDTWRVTPTFTMTYGLRWEYFRNGIDHAGRGANFVPAWDSPNGQATYFIDDRSKDIALSPTFISLLNLSGIGLVYTSNHQLAQTPETNFSPRIGFAWNLYPHTVLRGAYGIFYAGIFARGDGYNPGDDYPFSFAINITPGLSNASIASDYANQSGGAPAAGPMDKGLSGVPLSPALAQGYQISPRGNEYHNHIPYVQEENLSWQQLLTSSQSLTIAYVGTQSRHVEGNIGSNRPDLVLPTNVSVTSVSPGPSCNPAGLTHDANIGGTSATKAYYDQYPCIAQNNYFTVLGGSNNYNSMQVNYQKFLSGGTSLIANYTWSRLLGYGSDSVLYNSLGYRAPLVNGWGMKGEYGNLGFEAQNVFHAGGVWKLPFGYGRRWVNHRGPMDALVGGWNMTGIFTYQSGQAVTINCTVSTTDGEGCYALPDKSNLYKGAKTLTHWFNSAAFSNPYAATTIGQTDFTPLGSQPGQGFGPVFHRGDLGVEKLFHLSEQNVFEFRAEAFNITNTPNFGQPGTLTPNNSSFASINGTRDAPSDAREFQFALKYFFGNGKQH